MSRIKYIRYMRSPLQKISSAIQRRFNEQYLYIRMDRRGTYVSNLSFGESRFFKSEVLQHTMRAMNFREADFTDHLHACITDLRRGLGSCRGLVHLVGCDRADFKHEELRELKALLDEAGLRRSIIYCGAPVTEYQVWRALSKLSD